MYLYGILKAGLLEILKSVIS